MAEVQCGVSTACKARSGRPRWISSDSGANSRKHSAVSSAKRAIGLNCGMSKT